MTPTTLDGLGPSLAPILAAAFGPGAREVAWTARPLRGGLESPGVVAITARARDGKNRRRLLRVVAKRLDARGVREAAVYRRFVAPHAPDLAPAVLGADVTSAGGVLFLEEVRRARAWPWGALEHAAEVLRCVARLHAIPSRCVSLPAWDYPGELARTAGQTVETIERAWRGGALPDARRALPALRRLASRIVEIHRLGASGPLPAASIHGDLHTGNVVVRRRRAGGVPRITLVDWQRTRLGSPLEDVSSFLQSLAYWEPRVRARHDTLLGEYLAARGLDRCPSRALRDGYWIAGATNAFAGALAYHAAAAVDPAAPSAARRRAADAARDWLRILRRADEVLRGATRGAGGLDRGSGSAPRTGRPRASRPSGTRGRLQGAPFAEEVEAWRRRRSNSVTRRSGRVPSGRRARPSRRGARPWTPRSRA